MVASAPGLLVVLCALLVSCAAPTTPPKEEEESVAHRMATKTAYHYAPAEATTKETAPPTSCGGAVMLNLVARHGTRHSSKIDKLNGLAKKLSESGRKAPNWLASWRYPADSSAAATLTARGLEEHFALATRLKSRYPNAFPTKDESYAPARYPIRSTFKSRAAQSAEAFALGALADAKPPATFLAGGFSGATAFVDIDADDEELRFFDSCDAFETWEETLEQNATSEPKRYSTGPEMTAALDALKNTVGLDDLDLDDLELSYEACAYDWLLLGDDGSSDIGSSDASSSDARWCALLGGGGGGGGFGLEEHREVLQKHLKTLEYAKDLEEWYENGGGNPVAKRMPVVLLRDFVDAFDAAINGTVRGDWRFAHAETLLPFATMLGLFDAQPDLRADERDDNRLFRTSVVSPMAANLAATLHACADDVWRVKFLFNEQEVILPACADDGVYCNINTLKRAFEDALTTWDFDTVCENNNNNDNRGVVDTSSSSAETKQT